MTVSQLAELSNLSKSYISQVKHGKCPPSQRLLDAIDNWAGKRHPQKDYLSLFLQSRQAMGVSPRTLGFYNERLTKFTAQVDCLKASRHDIERFLNSIPSNHYGLGTRHATFSALKTFYRWLKVEHNLKNPLEGMAAPILGKPMMPSLAKDQVEELLQSAGNPRDKAVIALFTESGLRLSELANVRAKDVDWKNHTIRVMARVGKRL
jgi:integrase/recombinase XerD